MPGLLENAWGPLLKQASVKPNLCFSLHLQMSQGKVTKAPVFAPRSGTHGVAYDIEVACPLLVKNEDDSVVLKAKAQTLVYREFLTVGPRTPQQQAQAWKPSEEVWKSFSAERTSILAVRVKTINLPSWFAGEAISYGFNWYFE